jgi:hypothetical protein
VVRIIAEGIGLGFRSEEWHHDLKNLETLRNTVRGENDPQGFL